MAPRTPVIPNPVEGSAQANPRHAQHHPPNTKPNPRACGCHPEPRRRTVRKGQSPPCSTPYLNSKHNPRPPNVIKLVIFHKASLWFLVTFGFTNNNHPSGSLTTDNIKSLPQSNADTVSVIISSKTDLSVVDFAVTRIPFTALKINLASARTSWVPFISPLSLPFCITW
jgi:hypothetical protein